MTRLRYAVAVLSLLVVSVGGCSFSVGGKDSLTGPEVAKRAEAALEKNNRGFKPGKLTCGKVDLTKGSKTRCLRTVTVGNGNVVKIGATATVTREDPARLGVKVDSEPKQIGVAASYIENDLATQYASKYGSRPTSVSCPFLVGKVGNSITCKLVADKTLQVEVTVDQVDEARYDTHYTFRAK